MEKHLIEDSEIVKNFLNRTFFSSWKNRNYCTKTNYLNYSHLELQISGHCDQKCKYCYYAKYSNELYPPSISGKTNVLKNLEIVLNWLEENNYWPSFELFSGEIFSQELGFLVAERLVDWMIKTKKETGEVIVPTNFSFIYDDKKTERIEKLLEKCKENKIYFYLSASVDGKYSDENRPFKDGRIRTDEYYEKVFSFCKKWNFNFHPMIYNTTINQWKDNWLWFQEMMKKHEIPYQNIYLLEVRNYEWKKSEIKEYYKFIRFIVNWTITFLIKSGLVDGKETTVIKYLHKNKLFNAFNMFSTAGRGIGCSIQAALQLRLGDLTSSLCHRAAYKPHNMWKFQVENDKIVGVEGINSHLLIGMESADHSIFPVCESCLINKVCTYQCLGSMYEVHKEPMIPIPTVCALQHAKIAAVYDELYDMGFHQEFMAWASKDKEQTMKIYYKYFKGEK